MKILIKSTLLTIIFGPINAMDHKKNNSESNSLSQKKIEIKLQKYKSLIDNIFNQNAYNIALENSYNLINCLEKRNNKLLNHIGKKLEDHINYCQRLYAEKVKAKKNETINTETEKLIGKLEIAIKKNFRKFGYKYTSNYLEHYLRENPFLKNSENYLRNLLEEHKEKTLNLEKKRIEDELENILKESIVRNGIFEQAEKEALEYWNAEISKNEDLIKFTNYFTNIIEKYKDENFINEILNLAVEKIMDVLTNIFRTTNHPEAYNKASEYLDFNLKNNNLEKFRTRLINFNNRCKNKALLAKQLEDILNGHYSKQNEDKAILLINKGIRINWFLQTEEALEAMLFKIVKLNNFINLIPVLVNRGLDIDAKDEEGNTALILAIKKNKKDLAKLLIKNKADTNSKNSTGYTALMIAIARDDKDLVEMLIINGADINAQDNRGYTPLIVSICKGQKDLVELLIKNNNININAKDNNGWNALIWAIKKDSLLLMELLTKNGIDINAQDNNGHSVLRWAIHTGKKDFIELLINNGANINIKDNYDNTPLIIAVKKGSKELVELLIKYNTDINSQDNIGYTALMWAIDKNNQELVEFLLSKNADVNRQDTRGWNSLMLAVYLEHNDMLELLINKDIEIPENFVPTLLEKATKIGNNNLVKLLTSKYGDNIIYQENSTINSILNIPHELILCFIEQLMKSYFNKWNNIFNFNKDFDKEVFRHEIEKVRLICKKFNDCDQYFTNISKRLKRERFEYIKNQIRKENKFSQEELDYYLLEVLNERFQSIEDAEIALSLIWAGANINLRNEEGISALMWATYRDYQNIVELLINSGTDVNIQDKYGNTALIAASSFGHKEMVELLIQAGANIDIQNKYDKTALMHAIIQNHKDIAEFLILSGANIDIQEKGGKTALMLAISFGHKAIVELLIQADANVDIQNKGGETALILTSIKGNPDIAKLIIQANADVNIQNKDGLTALIAASSFGHKAIVELLIQADANIDIQEKYGNTALICATMNNQKQIIQLLRKAGADVNIKNNEGLTAIDIENERSIFNKCILS
ncbi:ankyrin repeat domain-containing protein [Candidatus Babela massiliensis]|uniref:Ankyrin repeats containing protein n=1 Tax=Candidatus Babela massiliensis TaxID=673862 RepID=V6DKM1_9BACT|nr:ankyrin repeat domain-containing protein [Candidatus Babela massiliensis]CDK31056.1 Ankyrin repeats containing protein [Candidatus Babela massiliensis]